MFERSPIPRWGRRVDRWIEQAALGNLSRQTGRLVNGGLLLAFFASLGIGWLQPRAGGFCLLLVLMQICFFHGWRGAPAAVPLVVAFYGLGATWIETWLFGFACAVGIAFSTVTIRKFRRSRRQELRLTSALDQARCVQQCLEPERVVRNGPVEAATYLSICTELGGDLLALRSVDSDRMVLLLADVMGKGVQAALAAAYIEGIYDELSREDSGPAHIVTRINAHLCRRFADQELFATMVCIEARLTENQWCYARAGHAPPVLCRAEGDFELMDYPGLPAGIEEKAEYSAVRIPMRPGDQLLLASDGLVEFDCEPPELAGLLQRVGRLEIEAALGCLVAELTELHRPGPPDDATAALLRVGTGEPAGRLVPTGASGRGRPAPDTR